MTPHSRDDDRAAVASEASEVSIELSKVLEEAEIRLPQFAVDTRSGDYLVRLGACNVKVARLLTEVIKDGLRFRDVFPQHVNRRS